MVSTLHEILDIRLDVLPVSLQDLAFQPFLRFWRFYIHRFIIFMTSQEFQPFLRFWGSRIWFLWVFKFFFGFLSSRRSV